MAEPDATLLIEPDEPAFVKHIDSMASQMEDRFKRVADSMKSVFNEMGGGGGTFAQTPVAKATKEMEKQVKAAKDLLRLERDRRAVFRAERAAANRERYGDDIELDEQGNLKRFHGAQAGRRRTISAIAGGVHAAETFGFGGGSPQSIVQGSVQLANMLAPEISPILNAIAGAAMSSLTANDARVEAALRGYQVGGTRAANMMALTHGGDPLLESYRKQMGFNYERFSALQTSLGRRTGAVNSMQNLMGLENAFGLGASGVNLLGASARSGNDNSSKVQEKALGTAFGLALSENIGRGRIGEIFDQLTAALEANTKGVADIGSIADRFLFISQLGPQYVGNTAASREMNQGITALSQGAKPYTQMTMLRAAGFGQRGVSYAAAWLRSQTGLDVAGGVSSEEMIKTNFGAYIPQYARGNADQRASIVMQLSLLTGMNGAQVKVIMDRLSQGPLAHVDTAAGQQRLAIESAMPGQTEKLLRPRQQATAAEVAKTRTGGFFNWLGGSGDERGGIKEPTPEQLGVAPTGDIKESTTESGIMPSVSGSGGAQLNQYRSSQGRFGARRRDTGRMPGGVHPGEDLFFPPGTSVYSPCNGLCIVAGYFAMPGHDVYKSNGWAVWIRSSDDGLVWQFVHLDPATVTVKRGSKVSRGDKIGTTLSFSQWQNGVKTHLHLGVQKNGQQTDPMQFDLSGIAAPTVSTASSGGGGPIVATGSSAPSSARGARGGAVAHSQVSVNVIVHDKTHQGIDVRKEAASYARQAEQPAPGDAPITRPDHKP